MKYILTISLAIICTTLILFGVFLTLLANIYKEIADIYPQLLFSVELSIVIIYISFLAEYAYAGMKKE